MARMEDTASSDSLQLEKMDLGISATVEFIVMGSEHTTICTKTR